MSQVQVLSGAPHPKKGAVMQIIKDGKEATLFRFLVQRVVKQTAWVGVFAATEEDAVKDMESGGCDDILIEDEVLIMIATVEMK